MSDYLHLRKTKKILIVFGTRPEAIKMAPLVIAFKKYSDTCTIKVCVTAQHREMLDQVLNIFDIVPDYDLNIMKPGQDLCDVTSNILSGMKDVFDDYQPNLVFVHGDTTTTFATTLAAFYKKIKIAHIEAGLRTGNIYNPWPEEANRLLTTQITNYHFAPTLTSKENLQKENIPDINIAVTGNTVIDALFIALEKIKSNKEFENGIINKLKNLYPFNPERKIILVTGHRRENHGKKFISICEGLKSIAEQNSDVDIVYPVHLNPNVQKPVKEILSSIPNVYLIEPLQYEDFIYLMDKSYFIITDSGGIQEEAPSLGKPVLLMRKSTERPEALEAGTVKLVGTDKEKILKEAQKLLHVKEEFDKMSKAHNPYGDGKACERVIDFLMKNRMRKRMRNL